MSHFTVLVIGDDVESLLEPYDENKECEPRIDITKEEAMNKMAEVIRDAQLSQNSDKEYYKKFRDNPNMSYEEFVKEWYGQQLDSEGNLLTRYNPDSKHDWYQIGGRWSGMLKLKSELKYPEKVIRGERSYFIKDPVPEGWCDGAAFCDIDWKGMYDERAKKALINWNELKQTQFKQELFEKKYNDGDKRKYIHDHAIFETFAVITPDGVYHSKGEMGWWGMSSETKEESDKWDNGFYETFLKELSPETVICVVDCHI